MDYLTISMLNKYLSLKFDRDPYLERVYVTGQVSNFRARPNHQYFSLKDEGAVIQTTIWGGVYKKLPFQLEEGMKVNVVGRVQLYAPSGSYSIIVEKIEPDGLGALAIQFEQLKKKLTEAGYFEERHKQALPQFVKKIGVVTSPSGAVIRDIITTVSRRFAGVEILLFPTKVQGDGASQEIAKHIALANQREDLDLLIVGRGGGSIEDLWAFNEEVVVEAIFESRLPVISSVGHETDTTLADFVADRRAATPTAAAELATPVTKADLLAWISERKYRSIQALRRRLQWQSERLDHLLNRPIFRQPERLYDGHLQKVDGLSDRLEQVLTQKLQEKKYRQSLLSHRLLSLDFLSRIAAYKEQVKVQGRLLNSNMANAYDSKVARFEKAQDALLSLDTERIISRGYALLRKGEKVITSAHEVFAGDLLSLELKDGSLEVEVKNAK